MKTKILFLFLLGLSAVSTLPAQQYFTKTAEIDFNAEGALDDVEEIRAKTSTGTCVFDAPTGKTEWAVLMKSFQFKNALMQEHFNENYVESSKYPKAVFKGAIQDAGAVKWDKDGVYPVTVRGQMTLHGVTRDVESKGEVRVEKGNIVATSAFSLMLADYDIQIPAVVGNKISKEVKINVRASLAKLVK